MERHRSCHSSGSEKRKRKHRSRSNSRWDDRSKSDEKHLDRLELLVDCLDSQSQPPVYVPHNVRMRDEQMIPIFDPAKDNLVIDQWTALVDQIAEVYNWDDKTMIR